MQITTSAISLNVDDVTASATFVKQHFGFGERFFQVTDPNGVVIQLVQWIAQANP